MNRIINFIFHKQIFALLLGIIDGILTALTLAAGRIISEEMISLTLALRIAFATSLTSSFVFFIAEYTQLRQELITVEKQLNITSRGKLATTNLGKKVFKDSMISTSVTIIFGFIGALIPLLADALFPKAAWVAIIISLAALGILGIRIASSIYANKLAWALSLMTCGIILSIVGIELHIV
jgi:predicted membrane protein (TIGR00267 family)